MTINVLTKSTWKWQYDTRCREQPVHSHEWPSARLQQLQSVSTGATTIPRQSISTKTARWQQMHRATYALTLMAQRKTAATPVHQHWSHPSSAPRHQRGHGNKCVGQPVCSYRWPIASGCKCINGQSLKYPWQQGCKGNKINMITGSSCTHALKISD